MTDTRYAAGDPVDISLAQPLPAPHDAKIPCYVTYMALLTILATVASELSVAEVARCDPRATRDGELNSGFRTMGAAT